MAEMLGDAEYRISINTTDFEKGFSQVQKTMRSGFDEMAEEGERTIGKNSALSKISDGFLGGLGAKTLDVISSGAKSFASNIFNVGTSFESTMTKVSAISGAAGSSLDALNNKARQLGKDTKYSASEVGEGFTYMAMAGWETEDMLDGIDGMLNLATAGCTDLGTASDIVTDNLTAFGMSAKDTNRMVDAMAATVTGSNTTVSMMGETLKYVGSTAGALGYSFEDVSVAIGLMANAGIKGSQAGTSLRSIMTRLANDTGGAATTLTEMGVAITDADGNMRDFGDVMTDMRGVFNNLSDAEKSQLASTIAGTEGMSGLLAVVNASDEDYNKLTESINNSASAAQSMADIMGDTTEGKVKELQSKIQELQAKAFDVLKPAIDFVIEALGFFVEHMEITIPVLTALGFAFATVKIQGFVTTLISLGTTLTTTIIPAVLSFSAALLTSPITWIIVGITAIIAAIVALIMNFDKVKEVVGNVFGWIGNFIGGIASGISEAFQNCWNFITTLFSGVGEFFGGIFQAAFDAITSIFNGVGDFFKNVWNTIVSIFTGIGKVVGDAVSGAFKSVVNGVLSFIESFINGPINVLNGFIGVINGAFGWAGVNLGYINGVSLPRMYTGGIVPGSGNGTPIIAGDGGEDEFVVPESKMASLIRRLEEDGDIGNKTFNFTFNGVVGTKSELRQAAAIFHDAYIEIEKSRFQQR